MSLLVQVAGVLAGTMLLSALARGRLQARALPGAALVIVAGLVAGATIVTASPVLRGMIDNRDGLHNLPRRAAETAGGRRYEAQGLDVGFWEWARRHLPARASIFIVFPNHRRDVVAYQWGTYRLLPRLAVDRVASADWLIFYKLPPSAAGYRFRDFAEARRYGPALVLARRRRAG
jgi:hypothetical protein